MVPGMLERDRLAADMGRAVWLAHTIRGPRLASGRRQESLATPRRVPERRSRFTAVSIHAMLRDAAHRLRALPRRRLIPRHDLGYRGQECQEA